MVSFLLANACLALSALPLQFSLYYIWEGQGESCQGRNRRDAKIVPPLRHLQPRASPVQSAEGSVPQASGSTATSQPSKSRQTILPDPHKRGRSHHHHTCAPANVYLVSTRGNCPLLETLSFQFFDSTFIHLPIIVHVYTQVHCPRFMHFT